MQKRTPMQIIMDNQRPDDSETATISVKMWDECVEDRWALHKACKVALDEILRLNQYVPDSQLTRSDYLDLIRGALDQFEQRL